MSDMRTCGHCFGQVALADAEFREEPAPRKDEPERTVTHKLHRRCAELSDGLVEMGRRLGSAKVEAA